MSSIRILAVFIKHSEENLVWGSELSFVEMAERMIELGAKISTVQRQPAIARSVSVGYTTFETDPKGLFTLFRFIVDTFRVAKRSRCDVIYVPADYWLESVLSALVASLILRKPLFFGILDPFKQDEDRQSFRALLKSEILGRMDKFNSLREILFHFTRRFSARTAKCCLVPTRFMGKYALDTLHARRVSIIGRGVDELWFCRSNVKKSYDAVFVGRFDKLKGVDTLLRAWKVVVGQVPKAKLLIIGAGRSGNALQDLSAELGISANVNFAGYISDHKVLRDMIQSASIFVFPSVKEGFARSVSEAMASGIPCILADIPELRDVYGEKAIFVTPRDHQELAKAVIELLRNKSLQVDLSSKGKSFADSLKWSDVAKKALNSMVERTIKESNRPL